MNHTSRGSKETLALLKLRTYAFYLINWSNDGMKITWSNDPPPGIEPVTTGMVSAPLRQLCPWCNVVGTESTKSGGKT